MFLKNLFKSSSQDNADMSSVKVGGRYFQVGGSTGWTVEKIFNPIVSDVPHAVIVRDGAETSKVISLSALLDQDIFREERRDEAVVEVDRVNKLRRRTDTKVSR